MIISDEYAAGFFDGEGTVYAAVRNRGYSTPTILATISNTVLAPLEGFKARWGGSIHARFKNEARRRQQYQWVLSCRMARPFFDAIHPHLIIKKEVVAVALQYSELMRIPLKERMDFTQLRPTKTPGKMTRSGVMRPEFRERAQALHAEIRRLNKRGAPFNATRQHSQSA